MSVEAYTEQAAGAGRYAVATGAEAGTESNELEQWLSRIATVCERAARGDLNVRLLNVDVDPDSDLGRTIHAVNAQLDYMESFVREVKAVLACAAQGKHFRRVPLGGMLRDFRLAVESINAAADEMQCKAEQIEQANVERLAVADEFERTVASVIDAVGRSAEDLSTASNELATAASTTSTESTKALDSSLRSVDRINHVAELTSEMHSAVDQIDDMARQCKEISTQVVEEVEQAAEIMSRLDTTSHSINNVVESIMEIAKQTQLLSLNAAIEAARAGTAGAGFAIVANEIQKLAERTREATQNAGRDIREVQTAAGEAVRSISQFGETIQELNSRSIAISSLTEQHQKVAGCVQGDVEAAGEDAESVKVSIEHAASAATETAASSAQLLELSGSLSEHAVSLASGVSKVLDQIRS